MRLLSSLVLMSIFLGSLSAATILLHPAALITDGTIRLADIASPDSLSVQEFESYKDAVIYQLPYEKRYVNITSQMIKNTIRNNYQMDVKVNGGFCVARWKEDFLDQTSIQQKAIEYLCEQYQLSENAKIKISELPLLTATLGSEISFSIHPTARRTGSIVLLGQVWKEGKKTNDFTLYAQISEKKRVYKLIHEKVPNEAISASDLVAVEQDVSLIQDAIVDINLLEGQQASHFLPIGKILINRDLKKTPEIKSGQMIMLDIINGNVQLKYQCVAKDSGYIGNIIRCQNPESKQLFKATVTGKNKAEIVLEEQ